MKDNTDIPLAARVTMLIGHMADALAEIKAKDAAREFEVTNRSAAALDETRAFYGMARETLSRIEAHAELILGELNKGER